jgi:hypothetical protein
LNICWINSSSTKTLRTILISYRNPKKCYCINPFANKWLRKNYLKFYCYLYLDSWNVAIRHVFFLSGFRKEWTVRNSWFSQLQRFRNKFYKVIVTGGLICTILEHHVFNYRYFVMNCTGLSQHLIQGRRTILYWRNMSDNIQEQDNCLRHPWSFVTITQ